MLVLETPVKGKAGDIIRALNSLRLIMNEGLQTGDFTQYLEDPRSTIGFMRVGMCVGLRWLIAAGVCLDGGLVGMSARLT